MLSLTQEPSPGGDHLGELPLSGQCSLLFSAPVLIAGSQYGLGRMRLASPSHRPSPAPKHLLFLVLPRPRRSDACPEAAVAAFLPGEVMGTGSIAGLKGLLCLGPFSEMLPWEESEEVDSVHEA